MRYANDPRWITVKYRTTCNKRLCGAVLAPGTRAFYYPAPRRAGGFPAMFGEACGHGEEAERDFEAHRSDEDGY